MSSTAVSRPCGDCFKPLAISHTNPGAASTPNTLVINTAQASSVATLSIKTWVAASPCSARVAASTGTKAWLNAPSANKRRNKFGMRKATRKASVTALAPKALAIRVSRANPVMRDSRVSKETVEADLKRLTRWSVAVGLGP